MKNLLIVLMLTLLAACGSGGSSGGSSDSGNNNSSEEIYTYEIRIEGPAGASIASNLITDFGTNEQVSNPVSVTLDATQLAGATFFGKNVFWDVQNNGLDPVTVRLFKDGVEIDSEVLAPALFHVLKDNL
jgi:hypothetical protein